MTRLVLCLESTSKFSAKVAEPLVLSSLIYAPHTIRFYGRSYDEHSIQLGSVATQTESPNRSIATIEPDASVTDADSCVSSFLPHSPRGRVSSPVAFRSGRID